jgi:hypothetical protein
MCVCGAFTDFVADLSLFLFLFSLFFGSINWCRAALFLDTLFRTFEEKMIDAPSITPSASPAAAADVKHSDPSTSSSAHTSSAGAAVTTTDATSASDKSVPLTAVPAKPPVPSNVLVVSHGLFLRLFLMRFYRWSVEEFHNVKNLSNCQVLVMVKDENGRYRLDTPLGYKQPPPTASKPTLLPQLSSPPKALEPPTPLAHFS